MSHPLRVVAHLGDVVEYILQGSIDLDAFFDTHGSASCAPNTFSAAMMPALEALRGASTLYSPYCLEKLSEKSRRCLQRSLTGHRKGAFRPSLASVYRPNPRSERCSYPFRTVSEAVFPETPISPSR